MRKRRITALVMALVLGVAAFSGCGKKDADSKYKVYYVNEDQGEILAESFLPSEEKTSTMVDEMTDKLNKKNAEGHTLLPNGVQIRECVNDDGMLLVDFTPEYRELNPVDEVLLRASIVKDYVQIPDIYLVTITVVGEPIVDSQGKEIGAMSLDNFLENTGKEIMAYQYKELNLYFTNEEGNQLVPETRQVYYNGNTPIEKVIVEQLLRGPGESGHYATLPSDTRIVGVSVADGIAYVNLGEQFVDEALTSQQASLLKRYTDEVLIIYDSDEAGVKAALRAIPMLKTAGLSTKVINLRPYKDPDEFIKNMGKEAFQERLDHGMNSFMYELKALEGQYDMEDPQGRTDFFKETAKRLLRFEDELERSSYIKTIARTYQVEPEELRKMVNRLAMKGAGMTETVKPKSGQNRNKEKQNGYEVSQKLMLTWLTSYPEIFGEVSRYIGPDDFTRPLYHQVAELLYEQYRQGEPNPARLLNQFTDSEEQTEVAAVFNATIPLDSEQEREQALLDVICRMKEDSIAHRTEHLVPTDMQGLMQLMQAKKELEELKAGKLHLHISFR